MPECDHSGDYIHADTCATTALPPRSEGPRRDAPMESALRPRTARERPGVLRSTGRRTGVGRPNADRRHGHRRRRLAPQLFHAPVSVAFLPAARLRVVFL